MSNVLAPSIWFEDTTVLLDSITQFIPNGEMSYEEQLNAMVRFAIYFAALWFFYAMNYNVFYIPIFVMLFTFLVYAPMKQKSNEGFQAEEKEQHEECTKPTINNPFMNVMLTDYVDNPNRGPACENVEEKVKEGFEYNLYKDVDDVWERNNSQRQYYTNPATTIPNDVESFANWCYKVPYSCKSGDMEACLKWEQPYMHGKIA
jgi:hypothetical protein